MFRNRRLLVWFGIGLLLALGIVSWRYATQEERRVFALDAQSGRIQWSTAVIEPLAYYYTPVVNHGKVFVEAINADRETWHLVALDTASGRQLWEFIPDPKLFGDLDDFGLMNLYTISLATSDSVYVDFTSRQKDGKLSSKLAAVDPENGMLHWTFDDVWWSGEGVFQSRVVTAGDLLVTLVEQDSANVALQALNRHTGEPVWRTELELDAQELRDYLMSSFSGPYLATSEHLIFFSTRETLDAFDLETGEHQFSLDSDSIKQIGVVGPTLYRLDFNSLTAFEAATGAELWNYEELCGEDGRFYRFQTESESIYLTCEAFDRSFWLMAMEAKDGRTHWQRQVVDEDFLTQLIFQIPAVASDSVFLIGEPRGERKVLVLSTTDGAERWYFPISQDYSNTSVITDGSRVFVVDRAPRWRNWLAYLNPTWH